MKIKEILVPLLLITSLGCSSATKHLSADKDSIPVVQGPTTESQTQLAVVIPKSSQYEYFLTNPSGKKINPTSKTKLVRPYSDTAVMQLRFTKLNSNTEYLFSISQDSALIHTRILKTLDPDLKEFNFAVASCMNDGMGDSQTKMWRSLHETEPEFIFLIGDNVYGDKHVSFYKGPASPKELWKRYIATFRDLDLYSFHRLIPVYVTWDDHDFGKNNGDRTHKHIEEAKLTLDAFYPREPIAGHYFKGHGVSTYLSVYGHDFVLLDSRSFRSPNRKKIKSESHLGGKQAYWLKRVLQNSSNPAWLLKGDQFFGGYHRFESFEGNHPGSFRTFLSILKKVTKPFVLISGDRHLTEVMKIKRSEIGVDTYEVTTSPMHAKLAGQMSKDGYSTDLNPRAIWGEDMKYNFANFTVYEDSKKMRFKIEIMTENSKTIFSQNAEVQYIDY